MPPAINMAVTLVVKNEEDIIGHTLAHYVAQGVRYIFVTDHASTDRTAEIVQRCPQVVEYIRETEPGFYQGKWVTRMARLACRYQPDWIAHVDADEFWTGFGALASMPGDVSAVWTADALAKVENSGANCREYLPFLDYMEDAPFSPERFPYFRRPPRKTVVGRKIMHRPDPQVVVTDGNHDVMNIRGEKSFSPEVKIDHYPVRSFAHFVRKVKKGGEGFIHAPDLAPNTGKHWRKWYQELKDTGLESAWRAVALDRNQISEALRAGRIFVDPRYAAAQGNS